MNELDLWSRATNSETGLKFEAYYDNLNVTHNGDADIPAFIQSEFGKATARMLLTRFTYEEDPMGEAAIEYMAGFGLKKEMFEADDYYTRYEVLTPFSMYEEGNTHQYPLVIANHGGSMPIEYEEYSFGLHEIAAKEGFMILMLQNTNWENVDRVLEILKKKYPVDPERVYMVGYSQGGYQVTSTFFRIPEKLAAVAPCGNDIFRTYDNFNVPYTLDEYLKVKRLLVPVMQIVGAHEASSFVPVNSWRPRKDWGHDQGPDIFTPPGRDDERDPTRIHGGRRRFSDNMVPPEGADISKWMISRLNLRMDSLNCEPRDEATCISYLNHPEDEFHHLFGFYGDEEKILTLYDYKHYIMNIWNRDGINAFRYCIIENSPHMIPITTGVLVWDFFKQFKRDQTTGKLIVEDYCFSQNK